MAGGGVVVFVGFISVPVAVLAGWLREEGTMATAIVETPTARTEDRNGALQERIVLDARIPPGPIEQRWDRCRFDMKLVNPANRRKHTILVVGSGLAGAAAAATLGEQGYHVHCFSFHDTPRRAHSIAAQGGINAAKNYRNDGDSVFRLFYDTVKGGDFRAREANAYRLAQVSVNIIDQCVAQGVPFARDYGGLLETRSFGGVQVERTFYARGQTGQQLLVGAYQALEQQIAAGTYEPTGWFEQRRRTQMVHWMWDLVNEYIQRVLHDHPGVREVSSRVEAAVRSGLMTAADAAESVIRAIGLG